MNKRIVALLFLCLLFLELPFCSGDSGDVYMDKPVGKENGDEPVGGILESYGMVNSTLTIVGLLFLLNLLIRPRLDNSVIKR